jgi:DNA-binding NarL/FixJ family response regulator
LEPAPASRLRRATCSVLPPFAFTLLHLACSFAWHTVVGEATSAAEALAVAKERSPDVAIVDVSLGGASGLTLVSDLRRADSDLPILVFSMHKEPTYVERALAAGASGYLTKGQGPDKVVAAVRAVVAGEVVVSEELAPLMLRYFTAGGRKRASSLVELLSPCEFEVFQMIGEGMSTRAIAEHLHRSIKTINSHRENIKRKMRLANAAELARAALRWVHSSVGSR